MPSHTLALLAADGPHAWWPLVWLVWLAVVAGVLFVFARRRPWRRPAGPRPEDILGERYARGEISADEYRERREILRSR